MSSHTPVASSKTGIGAPTQPCLSDQQESIALSSDKRSERNKKKRPKIQSDNVVSRSSESLQLLFSFLERH
jgi:hypothetical protein